MKRLFDITCSFMGLLVLTPVGIIVAILIKIDSKGPVFFNQTRVGLNQKPFRLHKFRTMYINSEKRGQLTVGGKDTRITRMGYWLRRFKLDELPQLWNVFTGEMSLVGPRPEVEKFVSHYSEKQLKVLRVRPGISDWASIRFRDENSLLEKSKDPEKFYIEEVLPAKINMNLEYIDRMNAWIDLKIILLSVFPFLRSRTVRKMKSQYARHLDTK